jgi:hypothetical protein
MTKEDFSDWTDAQVVQYFRDAALKRAKCGFIFARGNRIFDNKLVPAYEALATRGEASLRELLSLTDDPSPDVREDAAIFAFDLDPSHCREVLEKLIGEQGRVGIAAVVVLLDKSPEFAAEFRCMGALGPGRFLQEMDRRYPRSKTDD